MTLDFSPVSSLCRGPPKVTGPERGCEKLFNQPSGEALPPPRPRPARTHSSHLPPHPPWAQLLASPSTSLPPDFRTLGPLFLINLPQGGRRILRCLTSAPLPPSQPFPRQVISFPPGLSPGSPCEPEGGGATRKEEAPSQPFAEDS